MSNAPLYIFEIINYAQAFSFRVKAAAIVRIMADNIVIIVVSGQN